jgi:hypothetical protein
VSELGKGIKAGWKRDIPMGAEDDMLMD